MSLWMDNGIEIHLTYLLAWINHSIVSLRINTLDQSQSEAYPMEMNTTRKEDAAFHKSRLILPKLDELKRLRMTFVILLKCPNLISQLRILLSWWIASKIKDLFIQGRCEIAMVNALQWCVKVDLLIKTDSWEHYY